VSAAQQLDLDDVFGGLPLKPKKESPLTNVCKCTHERRDHEADKGPCSFSECECQRFKTRARPIVNPTSIVRPRDARDWRRGPPEIQTQKVGGWLVWNDETLRIYLENTKIHSYNSTMRRAGSHPNPERRQQIVAGYTRQCTHQKYRLEAALEQARIGDRGVPLHAALIRVGSPRIKDDDNLIPSFKHLRDAIAGELGFDDSRFNIGGSSGSGGDIPLFYRQQTAGARKAYAVLVEITWRST